jgi:capsular exopolysaccharide synthesis family protein
LSKDTNSMMINTVDIRAIIKIMKKRKYLIISGIFGSTLLTAVLSFFILKPVFEAQVLMRVAHPVQLTNTQNPDIQGLESTVSSLASLPKMTMQTHVSQLKSEAMAQRVSIKLNLQEADLNGKLFSDLYEVNVIKDTNLILLKAKHHNPALVRDMVNTLSREYIQFISEMSQEQMEQTIIFLEKQYTLFDNKLEEAISKWNVFKMRNEAGLSLAEQTQKAKLETEIVNLRKTMGLMADKTAETRIKGGIDFGQTNILVVSPADMPVRPVEPKKLLNITIAFLLGIFLFTPLAFLLEYLDYRIKTPDDVEEYLNLPVLGVIPHINSKTTGGFIKTKEQSQLVTCCHSKSMAVETYRTLQMNLSFCNLDSTGRLILVTSAVQNAGKSTVVSNLAVVLSQAGNKVLVVDYDLRKPSLHNIFGLDNSLGLLNILVQKKQVQECLQKTEAGPWVLTSGPIPPNPLEIISAKQTKEFLSDQNKAFDYVLVDTPPVLPVADAVVLSAQVDGVLLVLDSNTTPVDLAVEVKTRLTRVNAKILGVVLNRIKIKNKAYFYYNYQ